MERPIRIVLADDHPVVRIGVRNMLTKADGFDVVGDATDGDEAITQTLELQPDVLLLDVAMPRLPGLEAVRASAAPGRDGARPRPARLAAHQRRQMRRLAPGRGAQVEHALARRRGASTRATSIDPRDCGMIAPRARAPIRARRRGRRAPVPRADSALPVRRRPVPAAAADRLARALTSVLTRIADSAGWLIARSSARASSAPSSRHHSSASQLGTECRIAAACAGRRRRAGEQRPALPRGAPQHGVDQPAPPRVLPLGELDALVDRRVVGDAAEEQELEQPEPQRRQHRRVEAASGRLTSCAATWSSVARRCTVP